MCGYKTTKHQCSYSNSNAKEYFIVGNQITKRKRKNLRWRYRKSEEHHIGLVLPELVPILLLAKYLRVFLAKLT
jgi:hypothetical protein